MAGTRLVQKRAEQHEQEYEAHRDVERDAENRLATEPLVANEPGERHALMGEDVLRRFADERINQKESTDHQQRYGQIQASADHRADAYDKEQDPETGNHIPDLRTGHRIDQKRRSDHNKRQAYAAPCGLKEQKDAEAAENRLKRHLEAEDDRPPQDSLASDQTVISAPQVERAAGGEKGQRKVKNTYSPRRKTTRQRKHQKAKEKCECEVDAPFLNVN